MSAAIQRMLQQTAPTLSRALQQAGGAHCRGCGQSLRAEDWVCDLGPVPLANDLLTKAALSEPEVHYPLRPRVCRHCTLMQLPVDESPVVESLFPSDYPFFSGQSASWLNHCRAFAEDAIDRLKLGATSRVLEIGSNDGSMLRRFRGRGIPALGVEPSAGVAQHALMEGLPTVIDWWGTKCADRLAATQGVPTGKNWKADLVIAFNVLAHVSDLRDFLDGVYRILAPGGTVVFEVPYVENLLKQGQFDQIYAEHHCYFSIGSLNMALRRSGLMMRDVEFVDTHGGSIRVWAHVGSAQSSGQARHELLEEMNRDLNRVETYLAFRDVPARIKRQVWGRLLPAIRQGKTIVGYGASAKATTFLNYCGIGPEMVSCIGDTTPTKQGRWIPGVRIPVVSPVEMATHNPRVVVLFAWNWAKEATENVRKLCPDAEVMVLMGGDR